MTVTDLLQLPPVRGKPIFFLFSDKDRLRHLLDLKLWYLLTYAGLTDVVRQNDQLFLSLLNTARVGNNDDVEKLINARFESE